MSDLIKLIRDAIKWSLIISFVFIAIVVGAHVENEYNGPAREAAKQAETEAYFAAIREKL